MGAYSREQMEMPIFMSTRSRGRRGLILAAALMIVVAATVFRLV